MNEHSEQLQNFIFEHIDHKSDEGLDLINNLEDHYENKIRDRLIQHKKELNEVNNKIEEIQNKLDTELILNEQMKQDRIKYNKSIKNILILRQALNILFNDLWNKNKDLLLNINFKDLANNTPELKRKNKINESEGLKYALSVLHDKCINIDKNICIIYIKLNDFCHPLVKPKQIILDGIHNIKNNLNSLEYLREIGLTENLCDTLEFTINNSTCF
jgi:hypothetical protein